MVSEKDHELHILFFPFMAHGHMIPAVDMAKLFASRGLKSTIITTPLNEPLVSKSIESKTKLGMQIDVQVLKFPTVECGLPEECENMDYITSRNLSWEMITRFFVATMKLHVELIIEMHYLTKKQRNLEMKKSLIRSLIELELNQKPLEELIGGCKPDCLVSDMFFPWTIDTASKFGIPRLVFHGTSFFALCVGECLRLYEPYKNVSSDSEPFTVPNLPDEIKLTREQIPDPDRIEFDAEFCKIFKDVRDADGKSYGTVVNSFYELEPAYAEHYRKAFGRKAWHIGPLSLCNRDIQEKVCRGCEATISEHECLKWLDSMKPNSVIYVCFGSMANFSDSQLKEIAKGLEASGKEFIWVVRRSKRSQQESNEEDWLENFEKRMEGKGLIIRGWAPQVLILEHQAVGGFVTHCGWNSTLEGITAGLPMVAWPVSAEQFYNEKLVTEVLKIGVGVGSKKWARGEADGIKSEAIEKAITKIMEGEEGRKVKSLAKMARKAAQEGGSSSSDLESLIEELRFHVSYSQTTQLN